MGQGGRGHWAVYYTSRQIVLITFVIRWVNNFGALILFVWLIKLSVKIFQPLIVMYKVNFVYYYWGCTLIYRPLSYPFRSLLMGPFITG